MTKPEELRRRTKEFAICIIRLFRVLPRAEEARVIGRQLLRSGTSVAANYRAACQARSKAEFTAKMGIVVEEADETVFWLELLVDAQVIRREQVTALFTEANELLAIFAASQRTVKSTHSSVRQ
jgi:four helix bundle protein